MRAFRLEKASAGAGSYAEGVLPTPPLHNVHVFPAHTDHRDKRVRIHGSGRGSNPLTGLTTLANRTTSCSAHSIASGQLVGYQRALTTINTYMKLEIRSVLVFLTAGGRVRATAHQRTVAHAQSVSASPAHSWPRTRVTLSVKHSRPEPGACLRVTATILS